jgi:hypothetical protein
MRLSAVNGSGVVEAHPKRLGRDSCRRLMDIQPKHLSSRSSIPRIEQKMS